MQRLFPPSEAYPLELSIHKQTLSKNVNPDANHFYHSPQELDPNKNREPQEKFSREHLKRLFPTSESRTFGLSVEQNNRPKNPPYQSPEAFGTKREYPPAQRTDTKDLERLFPPSKARPVPFSFDGSPSLSHLQGLEKKKASPISRSGSDISLNKRRKE